MALNLWIFLNARWYTIPRLASFITPEVAKIFIPQAEFKPPANRCAS